VNTNFYCILVRLGQGIKPRSADYEADALTIRPRAGDLRGIHKRRPQSRICCPLRPKGVHQMRTSALFVAKNSRFFENYNVCQSARTREEGESVRTRGYGVILCGCLMDAFSIYFVVN